MTSDRYGNLYGGLDAIRTAGHTHLGMITVGTYDGVRDAQLLRYWHAQGGKSAHYVGFDLFEDLTEEKSKAELSKSKLPPPVVQVRSRLSDVPKTAVELVKGDTRTTLATFVRRQPLRDTLRRDDRTAWHLIFLDGGHSLATVASDWQWVSMLLGPRTLVYLDDYYLNRDDFGCKKLVEETLRPDPRYRVDLLDPVDKVPASGLEIRMVRVQRVDKKVLAA